MGLISFLFIAVNVIFWAFGGTLLGVGIWMAVDPSAFDSLDASGMDDAMWAACVYTMIGVGAFVFLVGFLGCCGAKKGGKGKSNIMLILYNVFVGVAILAEIVIIILTAIFWSNINEGVAQQMYEDVTTQYNPTTPDEGITLSWNKMQYKWKCCGSYNFTDYKNNIFATAAKPVPYTCCVYKPGAPYDLESSVQNVTECWNEARQYNINREFTYLNARGCYNELSNFFETNAAIIIGVTCGVLGLQIIGMIFACCLMKD